MSAFIVTDATIDRVVEAFAHINACPSLTTHEIGAALARMNRRAVNWRYNTRVTASRYSFKARRASLAAMYKACACLLYQCSEGNVPKSALYKTLDNVGTVIARRLTGAADRHAAHKLAFQMARGEPWDFAD